MQYAPYQLREGDLGQERERFADRVIDTLGEYAPNLRARSSISTRWRRSIWSAEFGLTGGNIFHGELWPRAVFFGRPLVGWSRYATPIDGLYLCGSGTHPGGGVMGASGHNAAREILRRRRDVSS